MLGSRLKILLLSNFILSYAILKHVSLCVWTLYMKRKVLGDQVLMVQNYNQQGVIYCTTLNYLSFYFRYNLRGLIYEQ